MSLLALYSLTSQILDIDDEIAQPDLDRDSFDYDSDPIDERVSPAIGDIETVDFGTDDQPRKLKIGLPLSIDERVLPATWDVETVDFGTDDQPRELKIGLPLSINERDKLIHLLKSSLDVFAWSYEDMPGLDPSKHHLPILPHARPVKQKLRR